MHGAHLFKLVTFFPPYSIIINSSPEFEICSCVQFPLSFICGVTLTNLPVLLNCGPKSRCSCRKNNIKCTPMCGTCKGVSCTNHQECVEGEY